MSRLHSHLPSLPVVSSVLQTCKGILTIFEPPIHWMGYQFHMSAVCSFWYIRNQSCTQPIPRRTPHPPTRFMSREAQSSVDWQGRKTEREIKFGESYHRLPTVQMILWPEVSIPATERSGVKPCQEAWHLPYLWKIRPCMFLVDNFPDTSLWCLHHIHRSPTHSGRRLDSQIDTAQVWII